MSDTNSPDMPPKPLAGLPWEGKAAFHLLPPEFLEGMAQALRVGALTHGERDWESGRPWSKPFGSVMRHLWAWWSGETFDAVSGLPHLWCAAAQIGFLATYERREIGVDDRPTTLTVPAKKTGA